MLVLLLSIFSGSGDCLVFYLWLFIVNSLHVCLFDRARENEMGKLVLFLFPRLVL